MVYDDKILAEIIKIKYKWLVCDMYFIHDLGDVLGMTVKYYERVISYDERNYGGSTLRGKEIEIKKEDYFKHIRNKKLKVLINNI